MDTAPSDDFRSYREAVESLVRLARGDTHGARAAAQVLLGVYNGVEWHMNLTDLCLLDSKHLDAALTVLRCRVQLSQEPHNVIDNRDAVFAKLWDQWEALSVPQRYKAWYDR